MRPLAADITRSDVSAPPGAFGTVVLSKGVEATDGLIFLAGANIGAAASEFGLAGLTRVVLDRRTGSTGAPLS